MTTNEPSPMVSESPRETFTVASPVPRITFFASVPAMTAPVQPVQAVLNLVMHL
jgi:hypothetical protein